MPGCTEDSCSMTLTTPLFFETPPVLLFTSHCHIFKLLFFNWEWSVSLDRGLQLTHPQGRDSLSLSFIDVTLSKHVDWQLGFDFDHNYLENAECDEMWHVSVIHTSVQGWNCKYEDKVKSSRLNPQPTWNSGQATRTGISVTVTLV